MNVHTRNLTVSAMFIALAVLFPIVFHTIGLGSAFLPLYWPIAVIIFLLPLGYAMMVAVLAPIVSFLFTGMPPVSPPILQVIMAETIILVCTGWILYHRLKITTVWSLFAGLIVSRIVLFFIIQFLASFLGLPKNIFSIVWVTRGVPGVAFMLFFVPLLIGRLEHEQIGRFFQLKRRC